MTLDDYLRVGEIVTIGAHHFDAASIKAFAAKFDPQSFHIDEERATHSVFGKLCASGWHTCGAWANATSPRRSFRPIDPGTDPAPRRSLTPLPASRISNG